MAALFLGALAVAAPGAAQDDATVAKPEVKLGDQWVYRRINYRSGAPGKSYTIRVAFAARGVIQIVGTGEGTDKETDTTFTDEWNAVSTLSRVFDPHTGWFRFPLQPGSTYEAVFEARMPKKGTAHSENRRSVKVVGWEEVVVPAGRFRALRIESEGRFRRLDQKGGGRSRNVIWYVPEVRRWVKLTLEITTRRGPPQRSGEELVAFELQ